LNEGALGSTIPFAEFHSKEFNIEFHFHAPGFAIYVHCGRFGAGEIKALPEKVIEQTPEYYLRGCVPS
jgi:hypothetical protein